MCDAVFIVNKVLLPDSNIRYSEHSVLCLLANFCQLLSDIDEP